MPPRKPVDLKQVGRLFKDTLAEIRDSNPQVDALEPEAIEWLKGARYKIMRQIEAAYYKLERTRDTPSAQPEWVNPTYALSLFTDPAPMPLYPYMPAFRDNIATLMHDCGFENCQTSSLPSSVFVQISFPAAAPAAAAPVVPQTLQVEDEFARLARGAPRGNRQPSVGSFSTTNFANLLGAARGQGSKSKAGTSKKRRTSLAVKDESDDEGPRLRSVTRASSTATLRSSAGPARRSARKRVKREE